jgi:hypothetical protein
MLIFVVQIGPFDIAPTVSIVCKFNDRPGTVHFLAANTVMWYLRLPIGHDLVYWCPTKKERPNLPHRDLTPCRPVANIAEMFLRDFSLLEPISSIATSDGRLLSISDH